MGNTLASHQQITARPQETTQGCGQGSVAEDSGRHGGRVLHWSLLGLGPRLRAPGHASLATEAAISTDAGLHCETGGRQVTHWLFRTQFPLLVSTTSSNTYKTKRCVSPASVVSSCDPLLCCEAGGHAAHHADRHPRHVDHKQSKRPRPASAAFSRPEPDFLLAVCAPVNSCTAPRRHGRDNPPTRRCPVRRVWPDLQCCPPLSHGSSRFEVDDRRTRECLAVASVALRGSPTTSVPPTDRVAAVVALVLGSRCSMHLFPMREREEQRSKPCMPWLPWSSREERVPY